ncbi:sensor histidine kinase [Streptomyces sp. NPDC051561]|uniref:sensor histidine kinase n=1 Tax=Streptomyces sp. NPDC051561 TaxID=3365658 RepID=UPI0037902B50
MDTGAQDMNIEGELQKRFFLWGPYALLALATAIALFTVDELMTPAQLYATGPAVAAAVVLHLWAGYTGAGLPDGKPAQARAYYLLRTSLALLLTYLNPFYSIYAVLGYFDTGHYQLGLRWGRMSLLVTAVTMAYGQSGGHWPLFVALFALHASLTLVFEHLGKKADEDKEAKAATIVALEESNNRLEQALAENAALHEQLILQAREAGVADERRRLAAEIHDTIAQALTGVVTQLQAASDSPDRATAQAHLDRATSLARKGLGEARRSVRDLSPVALEHDDLPEALKKTVADWSQSSSTAAKFTVTGTVDPLHDEIQATLLRIAQEALANTAKHAHATRVGVTLSYMGDEITLDVRDDGRGFDLATETTIGYGLTGMRARAERLAGTVDIESEPGYGTAISARVPLVNHA